MAMSDDTSIAPLQRAPAIDARDTSRRRRRPVVKPPKQELETADEIKRLGLTRLGRFVDERC